MKAAFYIERKGLILYCNCFFDELHPGYEEKTKLHEKLHV